MELCDEVRFPRFLYRGHTAMPPRGASRRDPLRLPLSRGETCQNGGGGLWWSGYSR